MYKAQYVYLRSHKTVTEGVVPFKYGPYGNAVQHSIHVSLYTSIVTENENGQDQDNDRNGQDIHLYCYGRFITLRT